MKRGGEGARHGSGTIEFGRVDTGAWCCHVGLWGWGFVSFASTGEVVPRANLSARSRWLEIDGNSWWWGPESVQHYGPWGRVAPSSRKGRSNV